MSRSLKITGDTKDLKKSILDLAKVVNKDLGKSKIELFTPDTKKMLRGEAVAQAAALKKQIDAIKDSTKRHQRALQDVIKGSKEELRLREKILKASQHIAKIEKDRSKSSELAEQMKVPGFKSQFMKFSGLAALMQGAKQFSGMGGAGMGLGGMMGGPMGMAAAIAATYGVSRGIAAKNTFAEGVDTRLKLRGRGVSDLYARNPQEMHEAGLNSLTLRQARLRDMDVFGRSGATQESVIQRAKFERNFGIEEGTLSGIAGNFRQSMGGKGANQTLMKLQASLIASGITDAIGPYLETAAQMLTDLNERGFTMDDSVLSLFNTMVKTGMGEGRIQKLAGGADAGIRGATGESNAFFQSVFNRAGIGGGTIGGAQAAMRMGGLFGVDLDKYKGMGGVDRRTFETLGIGGAGHMANVAGATLGSLDQMFGSSADINKQLGSKNKSVREGGALKRLSRLRYMMSAFGLKDEGQAAEVEGLLKKASTASPEERKKIMKRAQEIKEDTPELQNLKKINTSTEGIKNILENEQKTIEDALGERITPLFNKANSFLNSIDNAVLYLVKTLTGYETPEEAAASEKQRQVEQTASGKAAAQRFLQTGQSPLAGSTDMKDIIEGMTYEDQMAFGKKVKARMEEEEKKGLLGNDAFKKMYNAKEFRFVKGGIEGQERRRLLEGSNQGRYTPASGSAPASTPITIAIPALQTAMDKNNQLLSKMKVSGEMTAKNSKERGRIKPSSGSTSGN